MGAFGLAVFLGAAAPAAAEDDENGLELGLFKAALAEFRLAMYELKALCAEDTDDAKACDQGIRELRSYMKEARDSVTELAAQLREEQRQALEREKDERRRALDEEKAKLEAERRKLEADKRAFELAKKQQSEKATNDKAAKEKTDLAKVDLEKKRQHYNDKIAKLETLIAETWAEAARYDELVQSLRAQAAQATGAERDRLTAQADEADRMFGKYAELARKYEAEQSDLAAALAKLAATPVVASNELAKKIAKYEQQIKQLEDTIAYKSGLHDQSHAQAEEYKRIAAGLTGADRDKYLRKAAEADRQADEWERLSNEYRAERDRVHAELAKLRG